MTQKQHIEVYDDTTQEVREGQLRNVNAHDGVFQGSIGVPKFGAVFEDELLYAFFVPECIAPAWHGLEWLAHLAPMVPSKMIE